MILSNPFWYQKQQNLAPAVSRFGTADKFGWYRSSSKTAITLAFAIPYDLAIEFLECPAARNFSTSFAFIILLAMFLAPFRRLVAWRKVRSIRLRRVVTIDGSRRFASLKAGMGASGNRR